MGWILLILVVVLVVRFGQSSDHFCPLQCECFLTTVSSRSLPELPAGSFSTSCFGQSIQDIEDFTVDQETKVLKLSSNELVLLRNSSFNTAVINLVFLSVDNNMIETIEAQTFDSFATRLRILNLTNNHLLELPTGALRKTTGLRQLLMGYNRISIIPTSAFENLKRLVFLNLDNNLITTIESNAFVGLSWLASFDLSHNFIVSTPQNVFKEMAQQKTIIFIDFAYNNWTCGCFLKWPKQLVKVTINIMERENRVPLCSYEGRQYKWTHESIKSVTEKACCPHNCRCELNTVDCFGAKFDHLPERISEDTTNLSLAFNKLNEIDSRWWNERKINQLEVLNLTGNEITGIDGRCWAQPKQNQLREVDLSSNKITSVLRASFVGLSNLETLILNHNQIATVEVGAFTGLDKLRNLDLKDNRLEQLPDDIANNNKFSLLLANNPWNCSCNLISVMQFVIDSTAKQYWPTCAQPEHLKGLIWQQEVVARINCKDEPVPESPGFWSSVFDFFKSKVLYILIFLVFVGLIVLAAVTCHLWGILHQTNSEEPEPVFPSAPPMDDGYWEEDEEGVPAEDVRVEESAM